MFKFPSKEKKREFVVPKNLTKEEQKQVKLKEAEASQIVADCGRCRCHEHDTGVAWRIPGTDSVRRAA